MEPITVFWSMQVDRIAPFLSQSGCRRRRSTYWPAAAHPLLGGAAIGVLAEGVASAEDTDKAMVLGANHLIGLLALSDLVGNDITLAIMDTLYRDTGDPKYLTYGDPTPPKAGLRRLKPGDLLVFYAGLQG